MIILATALSDRRLSRATAMLRPFLILLFVLGSGCGYDPMPDAVASSPSVPAVLFNPISESSNPKLETQNAKPSPPPDPKDPRSWVWMYQLPDFSDNNYQAAVAALLADYEHRLGRKLEPGTLRRAGIKVMTETPGLSTPLPLVRAVISALEARGFKSTEIFIVDQSESRLHEAGFLPLNTPTGEGLFDGVQVIALERGRYYSLKWFYPSNLPAADAPEQAVDRMKYDWKIAPAPRDSLLPVPLLLDVDFWINLPVGIEYDNFGVAGALVNATLLSASNTHRFMDNPTTGARAVADIAAVPEFSRGWVLSLLPLENYQYIGGPSFNSLYTESQPLLLMSPNPVMLDRLLFEIINQARERNRLAPLDPPAYLDYARQPDTHLGDDNPRTKYLVRLP